MNVILLPQPLQGQNHFHTHTLSSHFKEHGLLYTLQGTRGPSAPSSFLRTSLGQHGVQCQRLHRFFSCSSLVPGQVPALLPPALKSSCWGVFTSVESHTPGHSVCFSPVSPPGWDYLSPVSPPWWDHLSSVPSGITSLQSHLLGGITSLWVGSPLPLSCIPSLLSLFRSLWCRDRTQILAPVRQPPAN